MAVSVMSFHYFYLYEKVMYIGPPFNVWHGIGHGIEIRFLPPQTIEIRQTGWRESFLFARVHANKVVEFRSPEGKVSRKLFAAMRAVAFCQGYTVTLDPVEGLLLTARMPMVSPIPRVIPSEFFKYRVLREAYE